MHRSPLVINHIEIVDDTATRVRDLFGTRGQALLDFCYGLDDMGPLESEKED